MSRILSNQLKDRVGEKVELWGRVYSFRKMGVDLAFLNLQDRGGLVQFVFEGVDIDVKVGSIVKGFGTVKKEERSPIGVEIQGEKIEVLESSEEELPFDLSKKKLNVEISTLLDNRPLTIRHETIRSIFNIYDTVIGAYSEVMRNLESKEIKTPKILGAASEGGANFFCLDYFDKKAFMAQSPQFYKQMCVGAFERVFEVGPAFRAERSFTTRHVNEYVSLDAEFGFIKDYTEIMDMLTQVIKYIFKKIEEKNINDLKLHNTELPKIPEKIPVVKLAEMRKIIKERYGYDVPKDTDIDPQGEAYAGQYAKDEFDSDFIFLTHYPKLQRPFYTMPDDEDPEETKSFDLIFKGTEITTGSQRIHRYDDLVKSIKDFGLDPEDFGFYLEAFKYVMPPHGGWGMGSERIVYKLLNLGSIKEAILFPRDVKRLHP
jgi:nondiscriminating aspartyl-tRNA synthetase